MTAIKKLQALTPSQTAQAVGKTFQLIMLSFFLFPHNLWAAFVVSLQRLSAWKRKGKMADDNDSSVKSHKMALDKRKRLG